MFSRQELYAIFSGVFAAGASLFGKLAFGDDIVSSMCERSDIIDDESCQYVSRDFEVYL